MMMGADKGPYSVGPEWIWNSLAFMETKNSTDGAVLEV